MRVWVDTDVGDNPDDLVALLIAMAHPEAELVGVSTVSGDVEARADLVRSVVPPDVMVVAGDRELAAAVDDVAPDAVLAIGPLTNVARLVDHGTRLPERLVVMGGALEPVIHRGARRHVETNFGLDPAATRLVIDWTDALVVPLDVTVDMELTGEQAAALRATGSAVDDALARWPQSVVLHDPLALLVAVDDADVTFDARRLGVDGDGRMLERPRAREHRVVVAADTAGAKARILELLDA